MKEKQNVEQRPKKRPPLILLQLLVIFRYIMPFAYMPLMIAYMEIILRLLCGYPFSPGLLFMIVVAFTAGAAINFIALLFPNPTVSRVLGTCMLGIFCVVFALEYFMFTSYGLFMTLETIFTGMGNVLGEFTDVFLSAILSGIPIIIAFFLPLIIFLVITTRKRIQYTVGPKKTHDRSVSLITLTLMFVFFILGQSVIPAIDSEVMAARTTEYNFDGTSRRLGLISAFALDIRYSVFGNPHTDSFVFVPETPLPVSPEPDPPPEPEPDFVLAPIEPDYETATETDPPREFGYNEIDFDFETRIANESSSKIRSVHEYVASISGSRENIHTGIFEGKNLIIITAEALAKEVIDPVMTPTLYRLMHNGFYFSDYYQPAWGGSTSSGEYSVLMGLAPVDGVRSIRTAAEKNLSFTIGNRLSNLGYYSAAFHNGQHTYYNRHTTHTKFGYSTWTAMGNGMQEGVRSVWPASDLEMIEFTVPRLIENTPFSAYYMTISGHALYTRMGNTMASKNWNAFPEQYDAMPDFIRAYMACNLELEYAMEHLVSALEEAGIADDTVIVMSTDHYPYGLEKSESWGTDKDYLSELFGFAVNTPVDRDHNALIIWSGALENELQDLAVEVSVPTFSLDILPTLLNLFGLEFDSRLFAGRDVFSDAEPLVFWLNRSWKTEFGFFNAGTSSFTPIPDVTVPESYVNRIRSIVANKVNISNAVLEHNYFNVLFDSDGNVRDPG